MVYILHSVCVREREREKPCFACVRRQWLSVCLERERGAKGFVSVREKLCQSLSVCIGFYRERRSVSSCV